jgi:hypothetical protein
MAWQHKSHRTEVKFGGACALVWLASVKVSRCRLVLRSVAPWNLTWREYAGSGFEFAKRSALVFDLVLNRGDWLLELAKRWALELNATLN